VATATFCFAAANFPAAAGIFIPTLLGIGFRDYWRDRNTMFFSVYRDKSQISRADVLAAVVDVTLDPDLDAYFHRSPEDTIDRRAKDDNVSDLHGYQKIHVIDGGGHCVAARMTVSGHGASYVDPVHEAAAEKGAERVGVVREHDLRHFRLRVSHWPRFHKIVLFASVRIRCSQIGHRFRF
jgi:hypothetical protein